MEYIRESYIAFRSSQLHNRASIDREEAAAGKFFDQALAEHDEELTNALLLKVQNLLAQRVGDDQQLSFLEVTKILSSFYITDSSA